MCIVSLCDVDVLLVSLHPADRNICRISDIVYEVSYVRLSNVASFDVCERVRFMLLLKNI